ncbi:MAG TPA: hypothetical protein VH593_33405 [Ktedonobacteraceae bacterium]
METKRCRHCHTLQDAEARVCIYCGHEFALSQQQIASRRVSSSALPPASPHRAGHYAGLHPEDQPYQSSMLKAQRVKDVKQRVQPTPEPKHITIPLVGSPRQVRHAPPDYQQMNWAAPQKKRIKWHPTVLAFSFIFLLIASSLLILIAVTRHASITSAAISANPDVVKTNDSFTLSGNGFAAYSTIALTYDTNQVWPDNNGNALVMQSDGQGNFSVQVHVPGNLKPGIHLLHATSQAQQLSVTTKLTIQAASPAPSLSLSTTSCQLGVATAGVISQQHITLINSTHEQITWKASSNQPWLFVSPSAGMFSGREDVMISVNRAALAPQDYTGQVLFTSQGGGNEQKLAVTMGVSSGPPVLSLSSATLNYTTTSGQNPGDQNVTIQNSGGQGMSWQALPETDNGVSWLSLTPASGYLNMQGSTAITVHIQAQQLPPGNYQGTIIFSGDAQAQIQVTCVVVAGGKLNISTTTLAVTANQGQGVVNKTVSLQNSGGAPIEWKAAVNQSNNWLSVTPTSGQLAIGDSTNVTIAIDATALQAGTYQGTITFSSNGGSEQVTVNVTISSSLTPTVTTASTPTAVTPPTV